jgi:hypothetical protein
LAGIHVVGRLASRLRGSDDRLDLGHCMHASFGHRYASLLDEAVHDKLPELGRQAREVGGESRHAHDQVGVGGGVLVGCPQSVGVQDVDVEQRAAQVEVPLDELPDLLNRLGVVGQPRVELELDGRGVAEAGLNGS